MLDLAALGAADFTSHVGSRFTLRFGAPGGLPATLEPAEPFALELVEVVAASGQAPGRPRRTFSLIFRGPHRPRLPQSIYRLELAALGALDLFLVPVGPDPQGMCYEAVFN
jgi:hypothetical protein